MTDYNYDYELRMKALEDKVQALENTLQQWEQWMLSQLAKPSYNAQYAVLAAALMRDGRTLDAVCDWQNRQTRAIDVIVRYLSTYTRPTSSTKNLIDELLEWRQEF